MKVIRNEKELLEVEMQDETLTHLIARFCKEDAAAVRDHPFLTEPRIVIHGKQPVKAFIQAIDDTLSALEEFKNHFKRAVK